MRKIRDVLRLRLAVGLSIRQIKASTKVSVGRIQKLLTRADELGLSWPLPAQMDDAALERKMFPPAPSTGTPRPIPDVAGPSRLDDSSDGLDDRVQNIDRTGPDEVCGRRKSSICGQHSAHRRTPR